MKTHLKPLALQTIYSFHEELLGRWPFRCQQGCSACCTQSVTMTGLEGKHLLGYLQRQHEMDIVERIVLRPRPAGQPQLTTNQFAAACLQGREIKAEPEGWNLAPCPFLESNACRVYEARPFGCRALASLASCEAAGAADTPPLLLSVNIMLMQVIEHLDQGGLWGNMLEVLACLIAPPGRRNGALPFQLRTSLPCPGFLIAPEEEEESWRLQKELFSMQVDGRSLGEYLGAVND